MRRNISLTVLIFMLFGIIFIVGNQSYFQMNKKMVVHDGVALITNNELANNSIIKLDGQWVFYPNILISPTEPLDRYNDQRSVIDVPSKWNDSVEQNEEGLSVGTYHLTIHLPTEEQYGLYIRTIRQANRIYINGEEVGAKGNPSDTFNTFLIENADKYAVYAMSENKQLDVIIHVTNYNYAKAGILYSIEFGTKSVIENHYMKKVLLDSVVTIGYFIFGLIYFISYFQNRKRKEELYFSLFISMFGLYMSFINQKIFFHFIPSLGVSEQIRLQLGIIPIIAISLTYFVYTMYPQYINKRIVHRLTVLLVIVFIVYALTDPFSNNGAEGIVLLQLLYVGSIIPVLFYNVLILFRALLKDEEGAQYLLIFLVSLGCYAILMVFKFLFDMPMNYSELLLLVLILYSFASLLSYRANASFIKVQQLSDELSLHNQLKDEFLIKTSKELRTPISRMMNVTRLLMEGDKGPLKREQQEKLITIHNDTQRLELLVEDLLFSSNYMAGEVSVTPRAVSISVIHEVIDDFKHSLSGETEVSIVYEIADKLPNMYTDELRIKQVLYNLLHNALQHTKEGEIKVAAEVQGDYMEIQVKDTGSGIPPQELEHIFDSFYRVNQDGSGLGLGLRISKNIIEKLNGQIYVTSTLGLGSSFVFTMPLALVKEDDITLTSQQLAASEHVDTHFPLLELPFIHKGNEQSILVVSDDHDNISFLASALILKGYTFIAVDNSYDALEYLDSTKVDCMIIDYIVSGISGYELCKKVRKDYDILELPIIILTSYMQHSDLMLSLQDGANDYVVKPIIVEDLYIRIQSLLAVRQSSIHAIEEEMNYLYSQVTPHFIYNTLNTIIGLSYKDIENTRIALYSLSTYFRAKLNVHYRVSMVSLTEEIELVKAYLNIEKMRLANRLSVIYDIDETIDISIPALSLQPLVENAVFHGISKRKEGGTIVISVKREGQFIRIKIDDNGIGIPKEKLQQLLDSNHLRIGLKNPAKKIKLIKNASLRLYSEEGKGTTVIILLPGDDQIERSDH